MRRDQFRQREAIGNLLTGARPPRFFFCGVQPADLAGPTGTTILRRFAGKGKIDFARWLLDRGADSNRLDGQYLATPLAAAARDGHKAMVELLLERGAHGNVEDELAETTALAFAIRGGHDEIADILRRRGATH